MKDVYRKLRRMSNTGELDIWLQRITYHLEDVEINYEEPLTKIMIGDRNVVIWNNDWVKPELSNGFPLLEICNAAIRDAQTPVIATNEVSIFEYV